MGRLLGAAVVCVLPASAVALTEAEAPADGEGLKRIVYWPFRERATSFTVNSGVELENGAVDFDTKIGGGYCSALCQAIKNGSDAAVSVGSAAVDATQSRWYRYLRLTYEPSRDSFCGYHIPDGDLI